MLVPFAITVFIFIAIFIFVAVTIPIAVTIFITISIFVTVTVPVLVPVAPTIPIFIFFLNSRSIAISVPVETATVPGLIHAAFRASNYGAGRIIGGCAISTIAAPVTIRAATALC